MNKIEQVAIGQAAFDGRRWLSMPSGERERYKHRARVAIEAMRQPTSSMLIDAGRMEGYCDIRDGVLSQDLDHIEWWQAMIDAALSEGGE